MTKAVDPIVVSNVLVGAAALLYGTSTASFLLHVSGRGAEGSSLRTGRQLMWGAAIAHAAFVVFHGFAFHVCPVKTIALGIAFASAVSTFVFLAARKALRLDALGVIVAPVSLVFLFASRIVGVPGLSPDVQSRLLPFHIAVNILADAFLLLAAGAAVLHLLQGNRLKDKRAPSVIGRIPSLDSLDRAAFLFVLIGYGFMTLGAISGTFWVHRLSGGNAAAALRVVLGYVTWGVFSGVVVLRTVFGWRGRRGAWGTLAGFVLALLVMLLYLAKAGIGGGR